MHQGALYKHLQGFKNDLLTNHEFYKANSTSKYSSH